MTGPIKLDVYPKYIACKVVRFMANTAHLPKLNSPERSVKPTAERSEGEDLKQSTGIIKVRTTEIVLQIIFIKSLCNKKY